MAFVICFAIRRKNQAELVLDEHLLVDEVRVRLRLDEVKNGELIDWIVPPVLVNYLRRYLTYHRKLLLADQPDHPAVWINRRGGLLSYGSFYDIFRRIGRRVGDCHLNPHLPRHAFATAMLDDNVHADAIASAGLAHLGTSSVRNVYDKNGPGRAQKIWRNTLRKRKRRH